MLKTVIGEIKSELPGRSGRVGGRQRKGEWAAIFLPSLVDLVSASFPLQSMHREVSRT